MYGQIAYLTDIASYIPLVLQLLVFISNVAMYYMKL